MLNHFKDDISVIFDSFDYSKHQIDEVLNAITQVAYNYEITKKETKLQPYKREIPDSVKKFLVAKKVKGLSERTLYNYGIILKIFFDTIQKADNEIDTEDIEYYLYWYQNIRSEKKITDRSLGKILDCLKSYFRWCYARKIIDFDPTAAVDPIKYEKKERIALTEEELEIVRRSCKDVRERAIVEFLYSTGCRSSELCGAKISDVDFDNKTATVFGKGKKQRTVFLSVRAVFLLKDYLATRTDTNDALFVSLRNPHGKIGKTGINYIMTNLAKRANLEKHLTCHVFRHTTATMMLRKGALIQDIKIVLGHENINTTMIYAHTDYTHAKEVHSQLIA